MSTTPLQATDGGPPAGAGGLRLTDRRLRELGRPFLRPILEITALRAAATGTRIVQALLVARILGHVLHGHGSIAPDVSAVAVAASARAGLIWARDRRATATVAKVSEKLRSQLFTRLVDLGPGYLVRRRTGSVETVLVDVVQRLGDYYGEFLPLALASILSVALVLAWVAVLDLFTGLVMVGAALLIPLAPILTARAFGEAGRQFSKDLGELAAEYLDTIQGMITLKAFNATARWGERLAEQSEEVSADATALAGIANMHIGFVSLGLAGGTVLGVALATVRTTHHALAGSALLAILLLSWECFRPLAELQAAFPAAYETVAGSHALFDLLDAEPEVLEPAQPIRVDRAGLVPSIAFEDVTFAYRADRRPALDQVSFTIDAGETVALVGPSGAGKTTVVSLLLRFFDPQAGTIRIGGHAIAGLALADLRALAAVTFQDSYLFHRTIRENLLLARPGSTAADIEACAKAANAHDFIVALPAGYDTFVGERGVRLSGGERQRLAIARALIADSPILVLDEPTSSVDAASEALITRAIERLTDGRTTMVIAHRLTTVQRADRVLVLDAGQIVEAGSPSALQDADGTFARLVRAQELSP